MAKLFLRTATALFFLTTFSPSSVSAAPATASGAAALAVAAVLAQYSPLVTTKEKKCIANLFEGTKPTCSNKLSIAVVSVLCRVGNVDITARSCEVDFGKKPSRSLKGRAANEVFATLSVAGAVSEGAAGTIFQSVSKLQCTLDPREIRQNSGGGADCSFRTGE
jgi:hypothetical protein